MTDRQLHLTFGSRYENIELVQTAIDEAVAERGADEDARHWIGLAVREAVANAIKHGNRQDAAKRVDVELSFDDGFVDIRVADQGTGFAPEEVRDPLAPENLFKTSGRGIFYMKRFMDDVSYAARPGGGTIVTLRKRISPTPDDQATTRKIQEG
jgi:serine/threonine-protein kinase RsbW